MDINLFEVAGKTVRRTSETALDAYSGAQSVLFDRIFHNDFKESQSADIMSAAKIALQHGDRGEAAHQLNRELYFCSLFDDMAGSKNEVAAHAGLAAIQAGEPVSAVNNILEKAAIDNMNAHYNIDSEARSRDLFTASDRVKFDTTFHLPRVGFDAARLAQLDTAYAQYKIDQGQGQDAEIFLADAQKQLRTASNHGLNVSSLTTYIRGRLEPCIPKQF